MAEENSGRKGLFGKFGFPVATRYPARRRRMTLYLAGSLGALALAILFAFDAAFSDGSFVSNGPLSSNHAGFGGDCASCHTPSMGVEDTKCAVCHEKFGDDLGLHSLDAHYVYRSGDYSRIVPASTEATCASCHREHEGPRADISAVNDVSCAQCHEVDSFEEHPQFDAVTERTADAANLHFSHSQHVSELRRKEDLADIEQTCLYCHNADAEGKGFEPIQFDAHCDACHLTTSTATPFVEVTSGASPGVRTLQAIAGAQAAGNRWAYFTNPDEFQARGTTLRKRPVYHADPWVLENLRTLRQALYPSSNLADLLTTSADVDPRDAHLLYGEAIETLRSYIDELRNQPDRAVQTELEQAGALLTRVERQLADPLRLRDETQFMVSAAELNPALTPAQVKAYEHVVDELTMPCQTCHVVEKATIKRVQADQGTYIRSEFNHRAHIIQARCLDCHGELPIRQFAAIDSIPSPEVDRAEIHNLPGIATCQTCHATDKAPDTCLTCHAFHPDTAQRSNLLQYLE
ncbi:MAG: cytochrome c3 family protein [Rhodothermales bacterium]|nr:cytochrome c3 family protein [Rhodothermales bacterium]